jgi:hypothetical protein
MTQDIHRCQVAARNVALVYNWWSLFVRAEGDKKLTVAYRFIGLPGAMTEEYAT